MPDNRELATAILLLGFLAFGLAVPSARKQVPSLLRSLAPLAWLFLVYLTTASALVWGAWSTRLWTPDLWWSTVTVVFGLGVALLSSAVNAHSIRALWDGVAGRTLGAGVFLGVYTNAATFPLVVEIAIQAIAAFAVTLKVVADHQGQNPGRRLAEVALTLIGVALLAQTTIVLSHGMPADDWLLVFKQAVLSIWFPLALAPLLYLVAYLSAVEKAAIGVRLASPRKIAKRPVERRLLLAFRLRLSLAAAFDRAWGRRYADAKDSHERRLVLSRFRTVRQPQFSTSRPSALTRLKRALGRPDASAVWDGLWMPRSASHLAQILDQKPPGWEWLAFGAHLWIGMGGQRARYRTHRRGCATRTSEDRLGSEEAIPHLAGAMAAGGLLLESIVALTSEEGQERAFGPPGTPGRPQEIRDLANGLVSGYVALMDWGGDLRGTSVPCRYKRVYRAAARMMDGPIEQIRHFVAALADQLDAIPQHVASGSTRKLTITMTLALSIRQDDQERFDRALRRLT